MLETKTTLSQQEPVDCLFPLEHLIDLVVAHESIHRKECSILLSCLNALTF